MQMMMRLNVFNDNGISVIFSFAVEGGNQVIVNAAYTNSNATPVSGFTFEAAVPKYIQMKISPPTGNELKPFGTGQVSQKLQLINSQKGTKPILMKVKLTYTFNGVKKVEQLTVNGFPKDL